MKKSSKALGLAEGRAVGGFETKMGDDQNHQKEVVMKKILIGMLVGFMMSMGAMSAKAGLFSFIAAMDAGNKAQNAEQQAQKAGDAVGVLNAKMDMVLVKLSLIENKLHIKEGK